MMQVLISLSESAYKEMCENGVEYVDYDIKQMMRDATPLPKGHGRIGDYDIAEEWLIDGYSLDEVPALLEADKEGAEDETKKE